MDNRQLLEQSWEELQAQMEKHRHLVRSALEGCATGRTECLWCDCPHRRTLLNLAAHSVKVLDDTRKAFKSKQLEALRKDLLRVLTEEVRSGQTANGQPRE
ncbi:MAG TPA: hypothetical protein VFQ79_14390 [Bryobacteraceae bacterium]|nr:hypothetical protein [Bryobacteraceae bacterium]